MNSFWWPFNKSNNSARGIRGAEHSIVPGRDTNNEVEQRNHLQELLEQLRQRDFEACELIVGVDFTKSNVWTGKQSFQGRCLHDVDVEWNPYSGVLNLVAQNLCVYDDDHRIPCYGFGDVTTGRNSVFSFYKNNEPVKGLDALLARYKEIVPKVRLSGPTTFAPLIRQAIRDVYNAGMKFHILLILADGQVSHECVEDTKAAIKEAAMFPIYIVMVGIGDGPWEPMEEFNRALPEREWNNFRFFEFNKIVPGAPGVLQNTQGEQFQERVLEGIPSQFDRTRQLTRHQNDERVLRMVRSIPSNVVIDPPDQVQ